MKQSITSWFRFRLRTLLIIVALAALLLSAGRIVLTILHRERVAEEKLISAIRAKGVRPDIRGCLCRAPWVAPLLPSKRHGDLWRVTHFDVFHEDVGDGKLEGIERLAFLECVFLFVCVGVDDAMEIVCESDSVVHLDLQDCDVTDKGIACIGQMPQLRRLRVNGTAVGANGFKKCVAQLNASQRRPVLETVSLDGCEEVDHIVEALSRLKSLKSLSVSHTDVTDVGMARISRMAQLEALFLDGTEASDDGFRRLGRLSRLEYLSAHDVAITADTLYLLMTDTSLKALSISSPLITEEEARELRKLPLAGKISIHPKGTPCTPKDENEKAAPTPAPVRAYSPTDYEGG